jgi:benzodiazapine receptor
MKQSACVAIAIGSVAAAALVGGSFGPQQPRAAAWYASLRKPPYTPPGPVIGAAWGVLEVMLCLTGYRLLQRPATTMRNVALSCWAANLAGLAGFSPVFFGRRKLGASLGISAALFASAAGSAASAAQVDQPAAVAALPLVLWTAFATFLSEELWRRN